MSRSLPFNRRAQWHLHNSHNCRCISAATESWHLQQPLLLLPLTHSQYASEERTSRDFWGVCAGKLLISLAEWTCGGASSAGFCRSSAQWTVLVFYLVAHAVWYRVLCCWRCCLETGCCLQVFPHRLCGWRDKYTHSQLSAHTRMNTLLWSSAPIGEQKNKRKYNMPNRD